ncbi:hypothetical protein ACF0H5_018551 [Mactra antiquata]
MILSPQVLFIFSLSPFVACQNYENVSNLHDTLLQNYKTDIRPLNNQSEIMIINLTLILFGIPDVDQVRGAVSYIAQLQTEWFDDRMTWTPSDHGGITDILLLSQDVWTPPIAIGNPIKMTKLGEKWMQVTYLPDGHAIFAPGDVVECSCSFYLKFWPFDKQLCQLSLFTFGYPINKLTLNVPGVIANTRFYSPNGEWALDKNSITFSYDYTYGITIVRYYFRLTRQSLFYLFTIILPINAIGALTSLVFLLPSASGERASYSITILLALAVFLTVISEDLPKTSDPIPIMCVFILFGVMISVAGLVIVIFNLILYHRDDKIPISSGYRSIVMLTRTKLCRKRNNQDEVQPISYNFNDKENKKNSYKGNTISRRNDKNLSPEVVVQNNDNSLDQPEAEITWKDVSVAVDRVTIIVMLFVAHIPSVIIIIYVAAASDFPPPTGFE